MNERSVLLKRDGPVAHLILNRPQKLNAIDGDCLRLLREFVVEIDRDPAIRAVVVRGQGRAFCAGADIDHVSDRLRSRESFTAFLTEWHETFDMVATCEKPTVAAVHGLALAGGLELILVCDLAVAADNARLGDQHAQLGLFPGGGSTQRLPRMIGVRRAKWLLLSGQQLAVSDAYAWGLVNSVVPETEVLTSAMRIASDLAKLSTSANRLIKRSIDTGLHMDLAHGLEMERSYAVEHMLGEDARMGLDAFERGSLPTFHVDDMGRPEVR